jgi:hypothetical protein
LPCPAWESAGRCAADGKTHRVYLITAASAQDLASRDEGSVALTEALHIEGTAALREHIRRGLLA